MTDNSTEKLPGNGSSKYIRAAINAVGGAIPIAGGFISALSGMWSEHEQERINKFFQQWLQMLKEEMEEKEKTVVEIMQRLDLHDEKVAERVSSPAYQSLLRKGFRDWPGVESEEKRKLVRNILSNAAYPGITSDDVIRMFIQWISIYSELHFQVVGAIYNDKGVTRARIWEKIGKEDVREDSADADLFKLLIRDLSTGGVIRQHRDKDYAGNFLRKPAQRRSKFKPLSNTIESAFEDTKGYELTELGQNFVHYAMIEKPLKLAYEQASNENSEQSQEPETPSFAEGSSQQVPA